MTGRNERCPCGSGKKYKHCHGAAPVVDDDDPQLALPRAFRWVSDRHRRAVDESLAEILDLWRPEGFEDGVELDEGLANMLAANVNEWLLVEGDLEVGGKWVDVLPYVLAATSLHLGPKQRALLTALQGAPLLLYTVTDVQPGEGVTLVDALDPEAPPIAVRERAGSESMSPGLLLGARVIVVDDHRELSGAVYPFAPLWASTVTFEVEAARADARHPDDAPFEAALAIASTWLRSLVEPPPLPDLVDRSTGEPIELVTDTYEVLDRAELETRLNGDPDVASVDPEHWQRNQVDGDGTVRPLAGLTLVDEGARLEVFYRTRSRAESGQAWVDARLAGCVRFVSREALDPRDAIEQDGDGDGDAADAAPVELPGEAMRELVEQAYRRTYDGWADAPLPALGGKSPREAIATAAGAERVRGLLRSYEANEARMAREQRREVIGFEFLWEAVGLPKN